MDVNKLLEQSQKILNDTLNHSRNECFMDKPETFHDSTYNQSTMKQSMWVDADEGYSHLSRMSFKSTQQNQSLIKGNKDFLHLKFLESLQKFKSLEDVFDTISEFNVNIQEVLYQMRNSRTSDNQYLKWLEKEVNVWSLVSALYQYRLSPPPEIEMVNYLSEKTITKQLYQSDPHISECQIIVDWLEFSAAEASDFQNNPSLEAFTDKTVAWENTLYQLISGREMPFSNKKQIISAMDPDAPIRQNKHLHPLDEEDERRLLIQIFKEVRCGRLDQAQKLCRHVGQHWRCVILEGWRLYHDPNYDLPSKSNERLPIEGNPNRDMWKLSAWHLSENQSLPREWRATIGAYCGNLDAILLMCNTWEDILWAHLKVYIDLRVEEEVREKLIKISNRLYTQMPEKYWNQRFRFDLDKVFRELENCTSHFIKNEAKQAYYQIEQDVILNRPAALLDHLHNIVSDDDCPSYLIRVAAHLVILFRVLDHSSGNSNRTIGDSIIKTYVKDCMKRNDPRLVAYYVSHLKSEDQNLMYAEFLEGITDPDLRSDCLQAAEENHLQIREITSLVVEVVKQKQPKIKKKVGLPETTEEDLEKINAIDWITFYPEQRADALWKTNEFMRLFVLQDKLDAARLALGKISDEVINTLFDGADVTEHCNKNASALREYLCHRAYLGAEEAFNEWFCFYNTNEPKSPPSLNENATYPEKVAYEMDMQQFETAMNDWNVLFKARSKSTKSKLYNVLLFPDGGWMVDHMITDEERQNQLQSLRKLVIPKVVSLLYSVLNTTKEYQEIIGLADIITSERHELYKAYAQSELDDVLEKIVDASQELLKLNLDPFGL